MAQNSKRNGIRGRDSPNFGPSQNFRTKKSGPSQNFDTWLIFRAKIKEKLNGSNFGPSQNRMHMPSRDNISFDDFLGHLGEPPVLFWKLLKWSDHYPKIWENWYRLSFLLFLTRRTSYYLESLTLQENIAWLPLAGLLHEESSSEAQLLV